MKKLLTEVDIINLAKSGVSTIKVGKNDLLTPLGADRIKMLGLNIVSKEDFEKTENFQNSKNTQLQFSKAAVGCDHTGFKLKGFIIQELKGFGIEVIDLGTNDEKSCDYPDFAAAVASKVKKKEVCFGIIIDATGIPSCIASNKFKGIRAATCYNEFSARSAREHNNANILVLGAKAVGDETNKAVLKVFLETKFGGERHQKRLDKISAIEHINFK